MIPLVGARRREQLVEAIGACDVALSAGDIARVEAAVPPGAVAGLRYAPHLMEHLDSERAAGHGLHG
jgi:hypothetical protein